jgi:hypothetical protein
MQRPFFASLDESSFFEYTIASIMDSKDRKSYLMGLRIAGDFGATIAVPVVLFVLGGQWLDGKYGTGARYTVIAFVLAALLSAKMIYTHAKKYAKEYEGIEQ